MDQVDYSKDYTELVQTNNNTVTEEEHFIELEKHCVDFIIINICLNYEGDMPDIVKIREIEFEGPPQEPPAPVTGENIK